MGRAAPHPDALIVLVPLVLSDVTVTVPLYLCTAVGAKVTVTGCELPAATVPLHAPLKPVGYVIPLTVSTLVPELPIVSVRFAVVPTVTDPNAGSPLSHITRGPGPRGSTDVVTVPVHVGPVGHPEFDPVNVIVPHAAVADVNVPLAWRREPHVAAPLS
jgi:hypothetical protein